MANKDRPCGFRPYGAILRTTPYTAGATVYPGDVVRVQADGKVDPATANQASIGVAATYASGDGEEVLVWDHPEQRYIVQADADGAVALTQADVGLNFSILATAGNSTYKQSRMELDASTSGTASTLPLRLVGFDREVGEAAGAVNAEVIVQINQHQYDAASEGA